MKNKILIITAIVLFGVLTRTVFHVNNNIEFITGIALASAYFLKDKKYALILTFGILIISDLIIGNSNIFLFTWSGFLITVGVGILLKKSNIKSIFINAEIGAIFSTLFFFFWTNFGVVVLGTMYSKDLVGLIQSYNNGLPFLVNQLVGNILIVPLVFWTFEYILNKNTKFDLSVHNKI